MPSFLEMPQNPCVLLTFGKVQNLLRLPGKTTSEPQNGASTSEKWSEKVVLLPCDFEM
jgi:hypothetical protein